MLSSHDKAYESRIECYNQLYVAKIKLYDVQMKILQSEHLRCHADMAATAPAGGEDRLRCRADMAATTPAGIRALPCCPCTQAHALRHRRAPGIRAGMGKERLLAAPNSAPLDPPGSSTRHPR